MSKQIKQKEFRALSAECLTWAHLFLHTREILGELRELPWAHLFPGGPLCTGSMWDSGLGIYHQQENMDKRMQWHWLRDNLESRTSRTCSNYSCGPWWLRHQHNTISIQKMCSILRVSRVTHLVFTRLKGVTVIIIIGANSKLAPVSLCHGLNPSSLYIAQLV